MNKIKRVLERRKIAQANLRVRLSELVRENGCVNGCEQEFLSSKQRPVKLKTAQYL